ncbi:hypothetical protein O181_004323 [Austropuccinia psidii MF-1]|uniref:Uncharacterized protein n=1 Tax=Austropuccinia psidii MF-1 TaxID=1389203 RepID=A0A9Q3BGD0_9BASI|nr:hypothetical protein [Austropuccinia psidii MF-1]
MLVQNLPPERLTRSKARAQAILTLTPREPLDGTPAVSQLRSHLERQIMEGEAPSRKEGRGPRILRSFSGVFGAFPGISNTSFMGLGGGGKEEEDNSSKEKGSYCA